MPGSTSGKREISGNSDFHRHPVPDLSGGGLFFARPEKNRKKAGKNAKKCLHFPEFMIYYLFITLRNKPVRFNFGCDDAMPT